MPSDSAARLQKGAARAWDTAEKPAKPPPNWYEGDAATIGSDVVLVFCEVRPQATKKKAFDKVLSQNGITPHVRLASRGESQRTVEEVDNFRWNNDGKASNALQHLAAGNVVRREKRTGNVELVYVEATPQQVQATLAGMAARPKSRLRLGEVARTRRRG